MKQLRLVRAVLLSCSAFVVASPGEAADERVQTTAATLLDRIQVEDFIADYYWELAGGAAGDLSLFWTADAVFDVNGNVLEGLQAIEAVYAEGLGPGGKLVFQPDIPQIRINGAGATVDLVYTGVLNIAPDAAPALYEQGHDHMELVKADGSWKISRRVLRSYSLDQSREAQ
jgi:hypothetical protein